MTINLVIVGKEKSGAELLKNSSPINYPGWINVRRVFRDNDFLFVRNDFSG